MFYLKFLVLTYCALFFHVSKNRFLPSFFIVWPYDNSFDYMFVIKHLGRQLFACTNSAVVNIFAAVNLCHVEWLALNSYTILTFKPSTLCCLMSHWLWPSVLGKFTHFVKLALSFRPWHRHSCSPAPQPAVNPSVAAFCRDFEKLPDISELSFSDTCTVKMFLTELWWSLDVIT